LRETKELLLSPTDYWLLATGYSSALPASA